MSRVSCAECEMHNHLSVTKQKAKKKKKKTREGDANDVANSHRFFLLSFPLEHFFLSFSLFSFM